MLDGVSVQYRIWLVINKFLNHSLIPFLGYFIIYIWVRHSKYDHLLAVLLPGNVLFQLASLLPAGPFRLTRITTIIKAVITTFISLSALS